MVDEDAAQASLTHDAREPPHRRIETVERVKDALGRPAVVSEQEVDLICSHRWSPST
jgi:hypothetical protein